MGELISISEMARRLGLKEVSMRTWARKGLLPVPVCKVGTIWVVDWEDGEVVKEWAKGRKRGRRRK